MSLSLCTARRVFAGCSLLLAACSLLGACDGLEPAAFVIPDDLEIEVVGDGFEWEVRYPGPDGRLGTSDDRVGRKNVHVPLRTRTTIHLRSRDFIYTFELPHLDLKEIAVPDLEYSLQFDAGRSGRYELRGSQMCGYTHPDLMGTLIIESPEQFAESVRKLSERGSK